MEIFLTFTSLGLICDGIGVAILGYAFFSKSLKSLTQESGTYFDTNPFLLESLVKSRTDGIVGTVLLVIGFSFQWLGAINVVCYVLVISLFVCLSLTVAVYFIILRKKLVAYQISKAKKLEM